jgi:hypothetical protein
MPVLASDLRSKLERTVIEARDVAEAGARAALEALAVHHHDPYPHQTPEQRKLRNHLRARARQIGDALTSRGGMSIDHLVHECAYEHWHQMLFARFLAENDLLIEPSAGVAISLQECEDLAKEAKADLWTYASRCAQQMLPQIFRPDDPLLQVTLAREHRVKLEQCLAGLDSSIFKTDDALGWVYQFWQSKKKEQVNASGNKIGAEELPAVTQLFTEDYMVDFLLDNTLGAWWAGKMLATNPKLAETAKSEEELRRAVALPGAPWTYLRFMRGSSSSPAPDTPAEDGGEGPWRPAAGTFEGWPKAARDLKCLDPCMGSGHFVTAMFERLVALRIEEEKLSERAAVEAVIRENLFGLEIDLRCTQIAAFNLALTAWRRVGHCPLPVMHLACSGLGVAAKKEDCVKLTGNDDYNLRFAMGALYDLFEKAPIIGSLINPRRDKAVTYSNRLHELQPLLEEALKRESTDDTHELAVMARGIAEAAEILAGRFTLLATNVPYLARGKQDDNLKDYCERFHPESRADLATCFVKRCLDFCAPSGSAALVTPQNWLFLTSYSKLRNHLLRQADWGFVAKLGPRAFETIGGEVVIVILMGLTNQAPTHDHSFFGLDAGEEGTAIEKATAIRFQAPIAVLQMEQLKNPDARVVLSGLSRATLLNRLAEASHGQGSFDSLRFSSTFWELPSIRDGWVAQQSTPVVIQTHGGCHFLFRWEGGKGGLAQMMEAKQEQGYTSGKWRAGVSKWGKSGVLVGQMGDLPCTLYLGSAFDENASVIVPQNTAHLPPLWAFCTSAEFRTALRGIDQSIKITCKTLVKVPFDLTHWQRVAAEKYPHGLPKPHSDDPTQWLFAGHPRGAEQPLQVAVARLLGYRWPRQTGSSFNDCPALDPDGLEPHADADGILCIPSVRGEEPAADRLLALLTACDITPDRNLDDWLRNSFFEEHCKLFHHRPFIWHAWDGRKRDGFHALVNYHTLAEGGGKGRKLLESLTYSYLGEWISRQEDSVKRVEEGAEDRLVAAQELQKRLIAILEGEPPFDLFVRWKPLHYQPIGWEPDINDGVRLNIRPFLASDLPNGRAGAGILRWKPNIKWEKDRGNEPQRPKTDFPWFWGWDGKTVDFPGGEEFIGERFNGCHYTVAAKRAAREAAKKGGGK